MRVVTTVAEMRTAISASRSQGDTIGFVPTMGYLHEGHIALVDAARREAIFTVMSVFVNPLQFGPNEDLARYPRDEAGDEAKAAGSAVDVLFRPSVAEIYRERREVTVVPGPMADRWEGAIRPGHFAGVLTVVAKLFNIVTPDVAIFGQKDFQQVALVRAMVRDLDFPLSIIVNPTVREADGLAMSSRNAYLDPQERARATVLSKALRAVHVRFNEGSRDTASLLETARKVVFDEPGVDVDYLEIVDPEDLTPLNEAREGSVLLIAARVGRTRLLDNTVLGVEEAWLRAGSIT